VRFEQGEAVMKLFIIFVLVVWLICGFVGSWWQEGAGNMHFKSIAKGPITLVHAFNDKPVTYPGPN
jgi:hypothetical protein